MLKYVKEHLKANVDMIKGMVLKRGEGLRLMWMRGKPIKGCFSIIERIGNERIAKMVYVGECL